MKLLKKISTLVSAVILACNATGNISYAYDTGVESIEDPALEQYARELGMKTDRFIFYNIGYTALGDASLNANDIYYKNYLQHCSNIELADKPLENFFSCVGAGYCMGISLASTLAHNKVFTPFDLQAGRENLIDIQLDDEMTGNIISYQTRQLNTDFQLYMHWNLAHYTKEEKVDMLLEKAQKATEQGKYFFIVLYSDNLNHAVTGIGMMDGEWEFNGEKYDKCILTYDSNALHVDEETNKLISHEYTPDCSIFVNSETKKAYMNFYYAVSMDKNLSFFALDDEDFMNFGGAINPSDSYETDVSDINRIDIVSKNAYSLDVTRNNGEKYDGIASCDRVFSNGKVYFCDGKDFEIQNTENAENFIANFTDINHAVKSKFNGAVNNIFKNETDFGFDTSATTEYDVTLVLEEESYDFTPHYKFDFSGVTDNDFKAVQTDRGIILSSTDRVKCKIKTSDVNRDENGLVTSAEENVQEDALSAVGDVLLTFDESGSLKYYIGENYDTEVQKGDVNCDGFINAVDATLVLESYSANSTGNLSYIGKTLGDYNGDGMVDAVDATGILIKYAELSTTA